MTRRALVCSLLFVLALAGASGCGPSRQEAQKQVVTGLDGASSSCITLYMTRYGERSYAEAEHLKPVCVDYRQTVVTMSLEQKSGQAGDVGRRVRVTHVQPGPDPVTVYTRTYWFDQNDQEGAEKQIESLVKLGAARK